MGGGAADERHRRVVPRLQPILEHGRHEMASLPIPDELMVDIFLRLPTPADLARASATCVSFRRLTADRSFLRRYRKLNAPPLLGFLNRPQVFYPAIAPHPSAPAASAVALAGDLSFSFLPAPASEWLVQDIRDGRVLLYRYCSCRHTTNGFRELVVCGPLHRRYLLLPPIPDDLAAAVKVKNPLLDNIFTDIFLVSPMDGDEAAATEETPFRVVWTAMRETRLVIFVFSSDTGQWRAIPSQLWSDLFADLPPFGLYSRQYAYGCFYLVLLGSEGMKLLVLDTETMEFSTAEHPPEANDSFDFAMVEAGGGTLGMFVSDDCTSDLSYFIKENGGGSSSQWHKVKTISLASGTLLACNTEKFLLLYQPQSPLLEEGGFTLDIETFQLAKVCTLVSNNCQLYAYSNFPPSMLSSPTISNGIQEDVEKPMLEQDAEVLPAEAHSHHDQNTAEAGTRGQAGVSRIGDGAD